MCCRWIFLAVVVLAGCGKKQTGSTLRMPTASIQPGTCAVPEKDGIMSEKPRVDHADRDLDGDGRVELIVVDRAKCDDNNNCFWNVFRQPREPGECARYAGTFAGSALETMTTRGEDNMSDVRAYWKQNNGRLLLQSYRFARDGYRIDDVLQCKRGADDRLDCADTDR